MTISLSKGGNISLSKQVPGVQKFTVGLGWDPRGTDGAAFDLDSTATLLGEDGKAVGAEKAFVFFGNLTHETGSVKHLGDNRTGEGANDDEQIEVDLSGVPAEVKRIVFSVAIHEADSRGQNFGQVGNAYIRLVNTATGTEEVRFDLSEEYDQESALNFAELYRYNDEWKFRALGMGYTTGLVGILADFGLAAS